MPAIFSSTSRINYVPAQESVRFLHEALEGHDYSYESGRFYIDCDSSIWDSIFFALGGQWIEILPKDFIIDVSVAQDSSLCMFGFVPTSVNFWQFGLGFLDGYYTTFIYEPEF
jgi:hypothetical protein